MTSPFFPSYPVGAHLYTDNQPWIRCRPDRRRTFRSVYPLPTVMPNPFRPISTVAIALLTIREAGLEMVYWVQMEMCSAHAVYK